MLLAKPSDEIFFDDRETLWDTSPDADYPRGATTFANDVVGRQPGGHEVNLDTGDSTNRKDPDDPGIPGGRLRWMTCRRWSRRGASNWSVR